MRTTVPKLRSIKYKNGGKLALVPKEPDANVVALLELALNKANCGEITSVGLVMVDEVDHSIIVDFAGRNIISLISGSSRLNYVLHDYIDNNTEEGEDHAS
jgi:hypothetical protein